MTAFEFGHKKRPAPKEGAGLFKFFSYPLISSRIRSLVFPVSFSASFQKTSSGMTSVPESGSKA